MPITRNSAQSRNTLEEFYQEVADGDLAYYGQGAVHLNTGQAMLQLLKRLNELFIHTQLWGTTSHAHLAIQAVDDSTSDWLIMVVASVAGEYYIEYQLPPPLQPWPNAMVKGEAKTLAEAERYLLIAMRECRGWEGNAELAALLKQYSLEL